MTSGPHTHTLKRTPARTHTHTHTHTLEHAHIGTRTHTHTHWNTHTQAHARTHTLAYTYIRTRGALASTHTLTHTHIDTHTVTLAQTLQQVPVPLRQSRLCPVCRADAVLSDGRVQVPHVRVRRVLPILSPVTPTASAERRRLPWTI